MSFKEKEKEPILSEGLKDVLKRALREDVPINQTVFNNTSNLIRIKNHLLEIFLSNEDLLRALHHPIYSLEENLNKDLFRYTSIFPFLSIPLDKSDVKNYLCFELNFVSVPRGNDKLAKLQLVVRIISHKDDIRTDWGIPRTDLLDMIISEEIDWTNRFGSTFVKIQDNGGIFSSGYFYRDLIYETTSSNNLYRLVNP